MVAATVERCREQPAYRTIDDAGRLQTVSWRTFYDELRRVAKSLIALEVGPGDKVDILSYSNYRWVLADIALATIGSCAVGIYHSLLARDVEFIVNHSDGVLVFAEDAGQVEKLRSIRDRIPKIRKVIVFDGSAADGDWVIGFEDFLDLGSAVPEKELEDRIAAVTPADVATIVYTSGTTGVPKGAVLTHDNLTFTAQSVWASGEIHQRDETLLFLPLAHVFARTCVFTALVSGTTTTFARGIDTIAEDFRIARPHWFPSVPRVYEKVHASIISGAQAKGGLALKIFNWALRNGLRVSDLKVAKRPLPLALRVRYAIADRLVFSKVQEALGGRVRWCISGAAPLNPDIGRFARRRSIPTLAGSSTRPGCSFSKASE
jgi:long-chain acyl-CoA synthetase